MSDLDDLLDLVPALRERRSVSELAGGLTNTNYKVETADGAYVVRVSAKDAGLLAIDRENEYLNTVAAADAGVGAAVIDYLPEKSILVLEFIEGTTQTSEDLRRGDRLDWVAEACRRLHGAMAARDEGTVPCNNDLLAENFIDVGNGFRLIDYEYSGMNDACFELGNVWSESNLSLAQLDELVAHYYGAHQVNKVARARLWGLMSKYGWTLWASIQDGVSDIDFDFWAWGMEKYERAVAEFDGPDFDSLIDDVQRAN
jgi:thiamine kinase-like enzyme